MYFDFPPFIADLRQQDVSTKPPGWVDIGPDAALDDKAVESFRKVKQARLPGANLRYARAYGAFLMSANLKGADLSRADLELADLRNADLEGADLTGANLKSAKLGLANLKAAKLSAANLDWADLTKANLHRAQLSGAYMEQTLLNGADLWRADLKSAFLIKADLTGATLTRARLSAACLWGAVLTGADMEGVNSEQPEQADPKEEARFPAELRRWTCLKAADLTNVNLRSAMLDNAQGLTRDQIQEALISTCTGLPTHLGGLDRVDPKKIEAELDRHRRWLREETAGQMASFSNQSLRGHSFAKLNLQRVPFNGALLQHVRAMGVIVTHLESCVITTASLGTGGESARPVER